MANNNDGQSRQSSSRDNLRHDFHSPIKDNRPVNVDGRPEDDYAEDDNSLFHTRPGRY